MDQPAADLRTRRLEPSDHDEVRALAPELLAGMPTWRPQKGQRAAVASWIEDAIAESDVEGYAVFVAVDTVASSDSQDHVLGFVSVGQRQHFTGEREAYVGELAVRPDRRRQRVARTLMDAAESWAQINDLPIISLETGSDNVGARALYAQLGYINEQVNLTKCLDQRSIPQGPAS